MWSPFFIFFCTTFLHFASTTETKVKALHLEGRIINGEKANLGQFPYQVSLRRLDKGNHICGGIIIRDEWILTAGHCMPEEFGKTMFAVAGDVKLKGGTSRKVVDFFLHPDYNDKSYENDIALLKLDRPFLFDKYINQIELNRSPESIKPNTTCTVAGWGTASFVQTRTSEDLLFVNVPLWDTEECINALVSYNNTVDVNIKSNICAGYREGGKDSCQGDSGGGLRCNHTLAGIVSKGYRCALPMSPGVYTNVEYFVPWIEEVMKRNRNWFERLFYQIEIYFRFITLKYLEFFELCHFAISILLKKDK